uniref:Uncharacterized protein n=1 Tax=Leersia perrieri TaxID=77586 RepID=A0A0D9X6I8_9ORYZ
PKVVPAGSLPHRLLSLAPLPLGLTFDVPKPNSNTATTRRTPINDSASSSPLSLSPFSASGFPIPHPFCRTSEV